MDTTFHGGCIAPLLFILFCCGGSLALYEGDDCSLNDGGAGTCKFLTDCPGALQMIQRGDFPQICGFEGTQSIVCCSGSSGGTQVTTTTTKAPKTTKRRTKRPTTTTTSVSITNRTPGEMSKRKCKEYAKYAYDMSEVPTLTLNPALSNTLECPFERLELIVGGTLASRQEFPHMSLIGYETGSDVQWACGGSLISENFVLTAGHCLRNRELGPAALVRVGLTNQSDSAHMQERRVVQIIPHPEYTSSKYHDIGLLKLSRNIDMDTYSRPACLQTERRISFNKAIASGWGRIEFSGQASNDLLKVVLEFFDVGRCNSTYKRDILTAESNLKDGIIDDWMICAGSTTERKDTCQGDSGGPLQVYHPQSEEIKCMYDIVGVTSFGKSCGLAKNVPGVYTRVSYYIKWIEDTVWPN